MEAGIVSIVGRVVRVCFIGVATGNACDGACEDSTLLIIVGRVISMGRTFPTSGDLKCCSSVSGDMFLTG